MSIKLHLSPGFVTIDGVIFEQIFSSPEKKGRRLGYMGHLIDMLNNIVEISKNSTELVALLNSSMDAEDKTNYEMVLTEMDVQLISQRRYLVRNILSYRDDPFLSWTPQLFSG